MKHNHLTIVSAIIILISACTKAPEPIIYPDPEPVEQQDTVQHLIELGKVSMKRDGQIWTNTIKGIYFGNANPKYFSIWTDVINSGNIRETFVIRDIPCHIGSFIPESGNYLVEGNGIPQIDVGWVLDGDQVVGGLCTDTLKAGNFIQVLRYDSLNKIAEGTFSFFLINPYSDTNGEFGLPDSLHVTEGKFHLKLE